MRKAVEDTAVTRNLQETLRHSDHFVIVAYLLLLALGLLFTVEPREAIVSWGEVIQFSTVEILLFLLLGFWVLSCLRAKRVPDYPGAFILPIALFWGSQLLATLFASGEQLTALKFCYRLTLGILTGWCTFDIVRNRHQWYTMLKAIALGGAVVGVIGFLEASTATGTGIADLFRRAVTRVGDLQRVSATLTYPTIAALVLELTLPLLLLWMVETTKRWLKIGLGVLLFIGMVTLVLTLSRAGIALLGLTFVGLAAGTWIREKRREKQKIVNGKTPMSFLRTPYVLPLTAVGAAATLAALTLVLLYLNPTARLRLVSETETEWYRATYESSALPTLKPGAKVRVPVVVTNTSPRAWEYNETQPFLLSYHLYREDGTLVTYDGARTLLDDPVAPGEQIEVSAFLFAPDTPGQYLVAWDMLQEQVAWFSWKENNPYTMTLSVAGTPDTQSELNITESPTAVIRIPTPTRFELWRIALEMVRERPLLGIGPDTFRLRYGYWMGYERFDPHIHTNNQGIEFLVGSGIIGLGGFLLFSATLATQVWNLLNSQTDRMWQWHFALAISLVVWYIHGMVDSFWQFTPTYILFWLLVSLAIVPSKLAK